MHSIKKLRKIIVLCTLYKIKYYIVGNASNILFKDSGFNGVIISLRGLNKVKIKKNLVYAYAGALLPNVLNIVKNKGLSGLEWSVGIPASVGGAVALNAGAYNGDINQILKYVYALDVKTNKVIKFTNLEYLGKYHQSVFTKNYKYVILYAVFNLTKCDVKLIQQKITQVLSMRTQNQKVGYPSLGCVFSRLNSGQSPAYLIEKSGLKGKECGGAQVSLVHSGYIVNKNNATSLDVLNLIDIIKQKIKKDWQVLLTTEIIVIGD